MIRFCLIFTFLTLSLNASALDVSLANESTISVAPTKKLSLLPLGTDEICEVFSFLAPNDVFKFSRTSKSSCQLVKNLPWDVRDIVFNGLYGELTAKMLILSLHKNVYEKGQKFYDRLRLETTKLSFFGAVPETCILDVMNPQAEVKIKVSALEELCESAIYGNHVRSQFYGILYTLWHAKHDVALPVITDLEATDPDNPINHWRDDFEKRDDPTPKSLEWLIWLENSPVVTPKTNEDILKVGKKTLLDISHLLSKQQLDQIKNVALSYLDGFSLVEEDLKDQQLYIGQSFLTIYLEAAGKQIQADDWIEIGDAYKTTGLEDIAPEDKETFLLKAQEYYERYLKQSQSPKAEVYFSLGEVCNALSNNEIDDKLSVNGLQKASDYFIQYQKTETDQKSDFYPTSYLNLAVICKNLADRGDKAHQVDYLQEAALHLERSIGLGVSYEEAHFSLAETFLDLAKLTENQDVKKDYFDKSLAQFLTFLIKIDNSHPLYQNTLDGIREIQPQEVDVSGD